MGRGRGEEPLEAVSGNSVCFIACERLLTQWKPMDCDCLAHYLGLDRERSEHQGLYGECRLVHGQLPVTNATSEFSVPAAGAWCAMLLV